MSRIAIPLVAVALILSASLAHAQLDNGIVAYWDFDGTFDDVAPMGGVNPDGTPGVADNGTPVGGAGFTAAPGMSMFGSALTLDGGSQQVDVATESSFDFGATGNGFTMSAWARVDAFDTTWQALVAKGEGSEFRSHRVGNSNSVGFTAGSGGDLDSGVNVNDGDFHHIVLVHEGTGPNNHIWIDGVLANSAGRGNVADNNQPLMIGENPDAQGREWEGQIDDLAFWNRPLSAAEIQEIFQGGSVDGLSLGQLIAPVPEPTSIALWTLLGLAGAGFAYRRYRKR